MNREEEFAAMSLPDRLRSITNEALWDYESDAIEAAAAALAAERDRADRAEARIANAEHGRSCSIASAWDPRCTCWKSEATA